MKCIELHSANQAKNSLACPYFNQSTARNMLLIRGPHFSYQLGMLGFIKAGKGMETITPPDGQKERFSLEGKRFGVA